MVWNELYFLLLFVLLAFSDVGELIWLLCTAVSRFILGCSLLRRYWPKCFICCSFSFPCIKKIMPWLISVRNNFLCANGKEERPLSPWFFFFCNSEVTNAEVVLKEIFWWILASLLGVFYFLGMGMEKPSVSMHRRNLLCLCLTSSCDLIARGFFDMTRFG